MEKKNSLHGPLHTSNHSSDELDTSCFNLYMLLSNINNLNPVSSVVIDTFSDRS